MSPDPTDVTAPGGGPGARRARAVAPSLDAARHDAFLRRAIDEDLGLAGDLTSTAIFPAAHQSHGHVVAREPLVVAGLPLVVRVFHLLDPGVAVTTLVDDGTAVPVGTHLLEVSGPTRAVLAGERLALNLLGRLSGIATTTRDLVDRVAGTGCRVADTRKTTPTLRALEKYAVRAGGGSNHRFGLHDAMMVKDNHVVAAGGIAAAVAAVRGQVGHTVTVEVEVDTLDQLDELLAVGADVVLLDNMDVATLRAAVARVDGAMVTEASGGVTAETIGAIAATGVDVVSVGALTHGARSVDVALDLVSGPAGDGRGEP